MKNVGLRYCKRVRRYTNGAAVSATTRQERLSSERMTGALILTVYSGVLRLAPFFKDLSPAEQADFRRAYEAAAAQCRERTAALGNRQIAALRFYFPKRMFFDPAVTFETLRCIEALRQNSTNALLPFVDRRTADAAEFDITRTFAFPSDPDDGLFRWNRPQDQHTA